MKSEIKNKTKKKRRKNQKEQESTRIRDLEKIIETKKEYSH